MNIIIFITDWFRTGDDDSASTHNIFITRGLWENGRGILRVVLINKKI